LPVNFVFFFFHPWAGHQARRTRADSSATWTDNTALGQQGDSQTRQHQNKALSLCVRAANATSAAEEFKTKNMPNYS